MKQSFPALKVSIFTFVLIALAVSCTKSPLSPTSPVIPPQTGPKPVLTIEPLDTGWFEDDMTVRWSALHADEVTLNGTPVSGTSYTFSKVTGPITVTLVAKNKFGSEQKTVTIQVCFKELTLLAKPLTESSNIWRMTKLRFRWSQSDPVWNNGGTPTCIPTKFRKDLKAELFLYECDPLYPSTPVVNEVLFSEDKKKIKWTYAYFADIMFLSERKMIMQFVNLTTGAGNGQVLEFTFER